MISRFLFALLCLTTVLRAAPLPTPEAQALIARLQEQRAKFPSLTADFTEERTTHLLAKPLTSQGTLAFQAPNKFRREIKGNSPSITVSNGDKLWIYYPAFKEAELYQLGQRAFFDDAITSLTAGLNFQQVAEFYRYEAFHEANSYRFVLTPRSGSVKRLVKQIVVTVNSDFAIQRTEATLPKGDRVITSYRNQRPTPIPASTFDFTPPAGTHITQPLGK